MNDSEFPDLLARRGPIDRLQFHIQQFQAATDRNEVVRAAYHGRWVDHFQNPYDTDSLPTVSIVIPLYNRAELVVNAIESCLEQDYPKIEIIVVDDGSEDAPEKRLASLAERIRFVRQENQGVSSARNHGLRIAQTDFVHFLDSDDFLKPGCISSKIAAFRAIADAEACTSLYDCIGTNRVDSANTHQQPILGDANCPTLDLLNTAVQRFPMVNCTVMAPRWVWLATGFFDENLRQAEDVRYWFRMALRGTKVIGLNRPLTVIRFTDNSLTTFQRENLTSYFHVTLLNLEDLLAAPSAWPYVGRFLCSIWPESMQCAFESSDEAQRLKGKVTKLIGQLKLTAAKHELSVAPMALVIQRLCNRREIIGELFESALREISNLIRQADQVGPSDAALWLNRELPAACTQCNRPAHRLMRKQGLFGTLVKGIFGRSKVA